MVGEVGEKCGSGLVESRATNHQKPALIVGLSDTGLPVRGVVDGRPTRFTNPLNCASDHWGLTNRDDKSNVVVTRRSDDV